MVSFLSFADGRLGTFIALDHLSDISKNDHAIDVVKFMNDMGNDSSVIMQTPVSWYSSYENIRMLTRNDDGNDWERGN